MYKNYIQAKEDAAKTVEERKRNNFLTKMKKRQILMAEKKRREMEGVIWKVGVNIAPDGDI